MYFLIYKITNTINGKFYIGKHKTTDINDEYMGSGKAIKAAIKKYGLYVFKKEILLFCVDDADMNAAEKRLVVVSKQSYNMREGGLGGFEYINRVRPNEERRRKRLSLAHIGLKKNFLPGVLAGAAKVRGKTYEQLFGNHAASRKEISAKWMRNNNPSKTRIICSKCGMEGSKPTMIRWHFPRCRSEDSEQVVTIL